MESVKVVPCRARSRIVFGIVLALNSSSAWSSVRIKTMLGRGGSAWAVSGPPGNDAGLAAPRYAAVNSAAPVSAILW